MKLYLARHGAYLANDPQGALSNAGIQEIKALAHFVSQLPMQITAIYHSGKLRAQQTAEIFATSLQAKIHVQQRDGLNPNDDVNIIANEVHAAQEDVLLVGHLPFMGRLVGKLLTGNENKEPVEFQTGTIVCLEEVSEQTWIIKWVLQSSLFNN